MADFRDAREEIRQRLGILDVVSEYVTLKRAGKGYKGLCPFHSEKTPSFTVSDEFQTWHCFGCGEHGDIFSFLMKIENLTFAEALERLAKRAGVSLDRSHDRQFSRRELLGRVNSLAAAYYSELLRRTPAAMEYLRGRGLADQTIQQFRLGYAAPAWDGLVNWLARQKVDLAVAAQAGLVVRNDRGGYYDRFRQRIIFPILDIQERVIGFGGRALGDGQPKYLNSPETPLFSKTRSLYGLNLARKAISESGLALVVEGYMDVITAHQAGFANCIATLGTALTIEHIGVLSRYTSTVVLAYDSDSAGMKAALRGAAMFAEAECDVRIARLPAGDDPDSLIRSGRVSEFDAAVREALPIVDYRLQLLRDQCDVSSSAGQAAFLKAAAKVIADVPTFAERERYIRQLIGYHPNWSIGLTAAQDQIRADVEKQVQRRQGNTIRRTAVGSPSGRLAVQKAESAVLRILLKGDEGAEEILASLRPDDFSDDTRREAASAVFEMIREKQGIYLPELLDRVEPNVGRLLSELAMQEEAEPVTQAVLQDYLQLIKNSRVKRSRTSDVLRPYMKGGIIDPRDWYNGQSAEEYREFLRKSGKLPEDDS